MPPGNFEMLSCLNELDLCGLFLKLNKSIGQDVIQSKKVRTSPTRLGVRAFQSCQGVWHYSWVFRHCCLVVHINVIQQQNISFSWMNRPSDQSSRRIIPVQFLEVLHTFQYFFSENKNLKAFFFFFTIFLNFLKLCY